VNILGFINYVYNFIYRKKLGYIIIKDINKATHWLAYKDYKSIIKKSITPKKKYKLEYIKDVFGYDYFIKDDDGQYSMAYMIHKGDFIKVLNPKSGL
jgi:hypothetical protein